MLMGCSSMHSICIITARGGSKRIPRKNIREFCGKPIIAYSIEAALDSDLFDEVMVSTDDEEIAEVARNYGAKVPFMRSAEASDDFADTADVLKEVLCEYGSLGRDYELFCCVYPTAPFVTAEKLQQSGALLSEGIEAVVPVTPFSFPPQRGFLIEEGKVMLADPESFEMRSQDLATMYHDCGQFYWGRTRSFLKSGSMVPTSTVAYVVPETEVQDIDNLTDWELAEMKYKNMRRHDEC